MHIKIKNPYFLPPLFVVISILSIGVLLLNNSLSNDLDTWMRVVSCVIIVQVLTGITVLKYQGYELFSPAMLFLFCLFLFYWGQFVLFSFFPNYRFRAAGGNMITRYPPEYYKQCPIYIYTYICIYIVGVIIKQKKPYFENTFEANLINERIRNDCKRLGYFVLCFTMPFHLYTIANEIILSMEGGYLATFNSGVSQVFVIIGTFTTVGFVLLMYSNKDKSRKIFIISCIYYSVGMFSGNRGAAVASILTMWCFYKHTDKKKKKMKVLYYLLLFVLAFFIMSALMTLSHFRDYGSEKSLSLFMQLYKTDLANNAFLRAIEEFGGTVADVSLVQIYLDQTKGYLLGWTYLSAFFGIIPNIGGLVSSITKSGSFGYIIQTYGVYGNFTQIGGSCIAESIINCGVMFWIIPLVTGLIMARVSTRVKNTMDYRIAYYVMVVYAVLLWVRGYFSELVRPIIWSALLVYFLSKFSIKMKVSPHGSS